MHQFLKFILFCSSTLHVSESLSVHHQESKMYIRVQHQVYVKHILLAACKQERDGTSDGGWKDHPKHVE